MWTEIGVVIISVDAGLGTFRARLVIHEAFDLKITDNHHPFFFVFYYVNIGNSMCGLEEIVPPKLKYQQRPDLFVVGVQATLVLPDDVRDVRRVEDALRL